MSDLKLFLYQWFTGRYSHIEAIVIAESRTAADRMLREKDGGIAKLLQNPSWRGLSVCERPLTSGIVYFSETALLVWEKQ